MEPRPRFELGTSSYLENLPRTRWR